MPLSLVADMTFCQKSQQLSTTAFNAGCWPADPISCGVQTPFVHGQSRQHEIEVGGIPITSYFIRRMSMVQSMLSLLEPLSYIPAWLPTAPLPVGSGAACSLQSGWGRSSFTSTPAWAWNFFVPA